MRRSHLRFPFRQHNTRNHTHVYDTLFSFFIAFSYNHSLYHCACRHNRLTSITMFFRGLLVSLFVALTVADSSVLYFTRVPSPITDGEQSVLLWSTNDTTTPVEIILLSGLSQPYKTVQTVTKSGENGQYIWKPSSSIADGTDYRLMLVQGSQNSTYGPFTIQGASPSAVASYSSSVASSLSAAR